MFKAIKTDKAPSAIGPYSQGVTVDNMIFLSGQIPLDPTNGEVVEGGVQNQTEQVMKNIGKVLEEVGATYENVVKTTIFIKDMNQFAQINEIYKKYFKEPYPARSTVEVARLPKDVLIEVELIAKK